ncbi:glycerophosphodiester phosphodiesterase family protein [Actinosynnema sp. NPDC059797]
MPPEIVAHRGASARRPEHTLAAYELALDEGADGLECDVRLTRDGHLVCVHDPVIDRTSDGTGRVSTMALADLRRRDFGSWHGGEPARVLTLAELLGLAQDRGARGSSRPSTPSGTGGGSSARWPRCSARTGWRR